MSQYFASLGVRASLNTALIEEQRNTDIPYPSRHRVPSYQHLYGRLPFCPMPFLDRTQSFMDPPPLWNRCRTNADLADSDSLT
jgi:hypothetical protein